MTQQDGFLVLAASFRHFRSISIGTSSDILRLELAQAPTPTTGDQRWPAEGLHLITDL